VIQLQSRLPEEVVATSVRWSVPTGPSRPSGPARRAATPERMDEILRVLAQIDRPPRRLVIHVGTATSTRQRPCAPRPARPAHPRATERSERVQTLDGPPRVHPLGESVPLPTWQAFARRPALCRAGHELPRRRGGLLRDAAGGRRRGGARDFAAGRPCGPGSLPRFAIDEAAATLRVRPGEWSRSLGERQRRQGGRGIVGHYATRRADDTAVQVMSRYCPTADPVRVQADPRAPASQRARRPERFAASHCSVTIAVVELARP